MDHERLDWVRGMSDDEVERRIDAMEDEMSQPQYLAYRRAVLLVALAHGADMDNHTDTPVMEINTIGVRRA